MSSDSSVLFHPENTNDPRTVRWRVTQPAIHRSTAVTPPPLAALVEQSILTQVLVEPDYVLTTLAPDHEWSTQASSVRAAITGALASIDEWEWALPSGTLEVRVQEVITRVVGPIAAGHGGSITLVSCDDGVVKVRLAGACKGCPASDITLQDRLRQALTVEVPEIVAVEAINNAPLSGLGAPAQALWRTIRTRSTKDPQA